MIATSKRLSVSTHIRDRAGLDVRGQSLLCTLGIGQTEEMQGKDVARLYYTFLQNLQKRRNAYHTQDTARGRDTSSTYTGDGVQAGRGGVSFQAFNGYNGSDYCNINVQDHQRPVSYIVKKNCF